MNYKATIKKQSVIISLSVIVMAIILIGTSFALFNDTGKSTNTQTVSGGTFNLSYSSSVITTQTGDIMPMSESEANAYTLNVSNTGSLNAQYNIVIYTTATNTLEHSSIKVKIDSDPVKTLSSLTRTSATSSQSNMNDIRYILKTPTLNANSNASHTIKVWVDDNIPDSSIGKTIGVDMYVEGIVAGSESQE